MVDLVKSGQLPLWNPYLFCGYPLLATLQAGFFYPISLLYYLLPFNLAFNYYTIIHYFLAALFMYWLMRHFALSRAAAMLSAIVFAFSGYLLSMANMNTTLSSVIWLPLILLAYDKYVKAQSFSLRNVLLLTILFAVQFLGGEPTVLYITTLFLAAYGVVESRKPLRNLGGLALALVLAGGLCAAQLLPFLEASRLSMRMLRTDYGFISYKSFPPRELINFLLPFFFGNLVKDGTYTRMLIGDQHQVWLLSPYFGFFPLLFSFFSLRKPSRRVLFFWAMVIVSLFLAFGRFTPVYSLFFRFLPGISMIRYPVKYIFLAIFSLAVLAGFGLEKIQRLIDQNKEKLKSLVYLLGGLFILFGVVYLLVNANLTKIFLYFRGLYPANLDPYFIGIIWRVINFDLFSLSNLLLVLFMGLVLFFLAQKGIFSKEVFNFLIMAMILIDLALANIGINPPGDYRVFKNTTPNLSILQKDQGLFRHLAVPPQGNEPMVVFKVYNENLFQIKDNLAANWLVPYRQAALAGRASMEPRNFTQLFWYYLRDRRGDFTKLLDLANVKYIFAQKRIPDPDFKILRIKRLGNIPVYLFENQGYLPRAFFVKTIKVLTDREELLRRLGSSSFDPKNEVLLEEKVNYVWQPARVRETVKVVENQPTKVLFQTFSDQPRLLFVSDNHYPGWRAFVDGKETKIYRANYMFRAVALPPGRHEVQFVYRPFSLVLGSWISLLTIALLGMLAIKSNNEFHKKI